MSKELIVTPIATEYINKYKKDDTVNDQDRLWIFIEPCNSQKDKVWRIQDIAVCETNRDNISRIMTAYGDEFEGYTHTLARVNSYQDGMGILVAV